MTYTRTTKVAVAATAALGLLTMTALEIRSSRRYSQFKQEVERENGHVDEWVEDVNILYRWGLYLSGRDERLERVRGIRHENCSDPPKWMAFLSEMRSLQRIHVSGNGIADEHFAVLSGLPTLERVSFLETSITDDAMDALSNAENLFLLDLSGNQLTGRGFQHLCGCPHLRVLYLKRIDSLIGSNMGPLDCLSEIEEIRFTGSRITGEHLEFVNRVTSLDVLDLDGTGVSDTDVRVLVDMNSQLSVLRLADTEVSDDVIGVLMAIEPARIVLPSSVSDDAIEDLRMHLPQSQILKL